MTARGDIVVQPSNQDSLWIKAQPHLLGQLVENLLDNACKYSLPRTDDRRFDGSRRRICPDRGRGLGHRNRAGGLDQDLRALLSIVVDFTPESPRRRTWFVRGRTDRKGVQWHNHRPERNRSWQPFRGAFADNGALSRGTVRAISISRRNERCRRRRLARARAQARATAESKRVIFISHIVIDI